jgi:hypothetical protein
LLSWTRSASISSNQNLGPPTHSSSAAAHPHAPPTCGAGGGGCIHKESTRDAQRHGVHAAVDDSPRLVHSWLCGGRHTDDLPVCRRGSCRCLLEHGPHVCQPRGAACRGALPPAAAPHVRLGVCPLALALLQAAAPQLLLGCQPAAVVLIPAGGQGQRQSRGSVGAAQMLMSAACSPILPASRQATLPISGCQAQHAQHSRHAARAAQ